MLPERVLRSVRLAKRAIDVVGGAIGLALTAPLMPVIAAAIYIESPGPSCSASAAPAACKPITNQQRHQDAAVRRVRDAQVPDDDPGRRGGRPASSSPVRTIRGSRGRQVPAQVAARRAAAVLGRAARQDEPRRSTSRAARAAAGPVVRDPAVRGAHARRQAGHHRARPDLARLHRLDPRGQRDRQARRDAAESVAARGDQGLARRRHADQAALRPRVHRVARAPRYVSSAPSSASSSRRRS